MAPLRSIVKKEDTLKLEQSTHTIFKEPNNNVSRIMSGNTWNKIVNQDTRTAAVVTPREIKSRENRYYYVNKDHEKTHF